MAQQASQSHRINWPLLVSLLARRIMRLLASGRVLSSVSRAEMTDKAITRMRHGYTSCIWEVEIGVDRKSTTILLVQKHTINGPRIQNCGKHVHKDVSRTMLAQRYEVFPRQERTRSKLHA